MYSLLAIPTGKKIKVSMILSGNFETVMISHFINVFINWLSFHTDY